MLIEHILLNIIENLTDSFLVEKKVEENGELRIKACYYSWLHAGMIVDNDYIVDRLEGGYVYVRSLTGSFASFPDMVTLTPPKFIYGDFLMTNNEIQYWSESDKNPFIWLNTNQIEEQSEFVNGQQDVSLDLYILSNCNYTDWLTEDHYNQVIAPLNNLALILSSEIANNKKIVFEKTKNIATRRITKFGEDTEVGPSKKYFNSDLSGLNLKMNTSVKECKCLNCKCK